MKKKYSYVVILFLVLGVSSCENSYTSTESKNQEEISNENQEIIEEEKNTEFEIVEITKSEFDDNGTLAFQFKLKNNTPHKFTKAYLSAEMKYVLQDGQTCNSVFQHGPNADIDPLPAENWSPNSIIDYKLISPDHRNVAGCNSMTLERTPKSVSLVITLTAISVDREVRDEEIVVYDLLPLWKEKQTTLGLR
jgi:hypothetical protein